MDNNKHGILTNIFSRKSKKPTMSHRIIDNKILLKFDINNENSNLSNNENKKMENNKSDVNYFKLKNSKTPLRKYLSDRIPISDRKYSINHSNFSHKYSIESENEKSLRNNFKSIREKKEEEEVDPFKIPPEDLIFNHPLLKEEKIKKKLRKYILIQDKNVKEKKTKKEKERMNKTYQSSSYKIFKGIYNTTLSLDKKVKGIKRNKTKFNLHNYQRLLINSVGNSLSKESIFRLKTAFNNLKNECHQNLGNDYNFIRQIEEEEKKIVENINNSEKSYLDLLSRNKSYNKIFNKFKIDFELPKISFKKIKFLKQN